jgi:hypothetical protein
MAAGRISEMIPQVRKHGVYNLGQNWRARIVIEVNGKPGVFHRLGLHGLMWGHF